MPELKWKYHISKNCFGKRSDQKYVKDGLEGPIYNRAASIKNYQKYENKWKRDMKAIKK